MHTIMQGTNPPNTKRVGNTHFDSSHCPLGQLLSAVAAAGPEIDAEIPPMGSVVDATIILAPQSRTPATTRTRDPPA